MNSNPVLGTTTDPFICTMDCSDIDFTAVQFFISQLDWKPATITDGENHEVSEARSNQTNSFENTSGGGFVAAMLDVHFFRAAKTYAHSFQLFSLTKREPYQALRYLPGNSYRYHFDGTGVGELSHRMMTAILYTNDDYTGGELEFPFQKIVIKPKKGMLLLFPSNYCYPHIAKPVIEGCKYSIVTWFKT